MKKFYHLQLLLLTLMLMSVFHFSMAAGQVIKEGDVIHITFPGEDSFNKDIPVETDGQIILPEVGPINVRGLDLKSANKLILDAMSKRYRDLSQVKITLRQQQHLSILGGVRTPGTYPWTENMSVMDLLAKGGGPNPSADTTKIRIVNDKEARNFTFNLEKFVSSGGDLKRLPILKPGDSILIPESPTADTGAVWLKQPASESIYVFGQVGAPGRYKFNSDMGLLDILSEAKGPGATADIRNIRIINKRRPRNEVAKVNLGLYIETGDSTLLPRVMPGDSIYVPSLTENWLTKSPQATVRVLGAVGKPGRYEFADNMTILDLLAEAGGPTGDAYLQRITVVNFSENQFQARSLNLIAYAKSGDPRLLPIVRNGDTVFIPRTQDTAFSKFLTLLTAVTNLGILVQLAAGR